MKIKGSPWQFFIVAILIFAFSITAFFGIKTKYGDIQTTWIKGAQDIRFGIDIRGGVDVTFMPADGFDATDEQMDAAKSVVEQRLVNLNITDNEVYTDYNKDRIIVRFPWKEGETEFNPESAIQEIGATARLTFREGHETDADGKPSGVTAQNVILEGADIKSAVPGVNGDRNSPEYGQYYISLELNEDGAKKFADATKRLSEPQSNGAKGTISIWMDDTLLSYPTVQTAITDGHASITLGGSGDAAREEAVRMANQINSGALPFALKAENFSTISPSLGENSLDAMVMAGVIAFILVAVFMILNYRLPGFVAVIALLGQVAMTLAFVSGYFGGLNSFTLTLPGIAGIILAIGMGVDANVITSERIKEEILKGKTIEGALKTGFERGLAPIIDGNVTVIIVAAILMGAFGPTNGFFSKLLTPIFFAFGPSTAGSIYSFGYTLLVGVLLNFVFGVVCMRFMLRGISKFQFLRNPVLYGGKKADSTKEVRVKDIVGKRKYFITFSSVLIAVIVLGTVVLGVQMDIQFKGGAMITYHYTGELNTQMIQKTAKEILKSEVSIQKGSSIASDEQTLTISLPGEQTLDTQTVDALNKELTTKYPESKLEQVAINNVDPTIGGEFFAKSLVAIFAAVVLILIYIAIRFQKIGGLRGAATGILALIHDMIVVFGAFVFLRIPLNGNFIAAMLVILGYSINSTVVIYDRIRENETMLSSKKHFNFPMLVNQGINQSLKRTVNTTISTLLALGTVCVVSVVFGLDSIFTFAFPLMLGMLSGMYSSLCIAGPVWTLWEEKSKTTKKKKSA